MRVFERRAVAPPRALVAFFGCQNPRSPRQAVFDRPELLCLQQIRFPFIPRGSTFLLTACQHGIFLGRSAVLQKYPAGFGAWSQSESPMRNSQLTVYKRYGKSLTNRRGHFTHRRAARAPPRLFVARRTAIESTARVNVPSGASKTAPNARVDRGRGNLRPRICARPLKNTQPCHA